MTALTVGIMDNRQPFSVGIGHVLIAGVTGSGKGGALWSIIMALTPLRDAGLAVFYGIDPKRAELVGVGGAFVRVEYDPAGAAAVLDDVLALMDERKQLGQRTFAATPARPFAFLVIDELPGLLLDPDTARRKRVVEMLNLIGSQGRSLGVYLVAATQQVQKEVLGQLRGHFQNRIALRLETAVEVDLVLGAGSVLAGAKSHDIAPATESNGYATAGIAYARSDAEPIPVRFRFPRVTDDDITRWLERSAPRA
jgi:S-DNA-T family DNA segregation ATPase FtsK/SpoIIIE